jgi:Holliday junction DNA helicase RuvB
MRPVSDFHGLVGQKQVVRYLSGLIDGAPARGLVMPSILLVGPPGHGKTAVARACARRIGCRCHEFNKGRDLSNASLICALRKVEHGDVVFVDEAHAVPQDTTETLYFAIEEGRLPLPGSRDGGAPKTESIAAFTLIAATNRPGQVTSALRSRLEIVSLVEYSEREIAEIIRRCADAEGFDITSQAAGALAKVAQGSPRLAVRLLNLAWLTCHDAERVDQQHIRAFLRARGMDGHGLTQEQRKALRALLAAPRNTLSAAALAIRLGPDSEYVEEEVERWLVTKGLVDVTPKGRALTPTGLKLAELLADEAGEEEGS